MDLLALKRHYGRLKGIKDLAATQMFVHHSVCDDYNVIALEIGKILGENVNSFLIPSFNSYDDSTVLSDRINDKVFQLVAFLEYGYHLSDQVIPVGNLYNSIRDEELKSRCSDILSSPGNFDRVINQATLILEDRIRTKSKCDGGLVGVQLVNKALNSDLSKSIVRVSKNQEEHEGICHICRGIMLSFRNPTHHYVTDRFSREDALKLVAFIDSLLEVIGKAEVS